MGELLRIETLNYTKGIDPKKDKWNTNKVKVINNKMWNEKEYTKAYIKLLTDFTNGGIN